MFCFKAFSTDLSFLNICQVRVRLNLNFFFTGSPLQCHVPLDGRIFHVQAHAPALRGQPDGRAHAEGHHTVLRLRAGKTEGTYLFNWLYYEAQA